MSKLTLFSKFKPAPEQAGITERLRVCVDYLEDNLDSIVSRHVSDKDLDRLESFKNELDDIRADIADAKLWINSTVDALRNYATDIDENNVL